MGLLVLVEHRAVRQFSYVAYLDLATGLGGVARAACQLAVEDAFWQLVNAGTRPLVGQEAFLRSQAFVDLRLFGGRAGLFFVLLEDGLHARLVEL